MPTLQTQRLTIRPFRADELDAVYHLFDEAIYPPGVSRAQRAEWLYWAAANPRGLETVGQPPYGDRAVTLKDGALVGSVGIVPIVSRIPVELGGQGDRAQAEVGLYWAIHPDHRRRGYAAEAARALVEHMFSVENLWRIIAQTSGENLASQAVMRALGMQVHQVKDPIPAWNDIIGVLENK